MFLRRWSCICPSSSSSSSVNVSNIRTAVYHYFPTAQFSQYFFSVFVKQVNKLVLIFLLLTEPGSILDKVDHQKTLCKSVCKSHKSDRESCWRWGEGSVVFPSSVLLSKCRRTSFPNGRECCKVCGLPERCGICPTDTRSHDNMKLEVMQNIPKLSFNMREVRAKTAESQH